VTRTVVCGVPRAGKTTLGLVLARAAGVTLGSTDNLIGTHDWSEASAEAALWLGREGSYVLEGVAMVRALRKFLEKSDAKPCDRVIWMPAPRVVLSPGQHVMAQGCRTIWNEVRPALLARRVEVETRP